MIEDKQRIGRFAKSLIPKETPDVIEWAEKNVILPGSARSKQFKSSITPWIVEPLRRAVDDMTRVLTFMKPVQTGGSALGEVLMLFWIVFSRGFFQYNWSTDKRSTERWNSRISGIMDACEVVAKMLGNAKLSKGEEINFGSVFFRMQGVFVPDNLDSDSVRLQINEEVHSWEPGHLKKARNRLTAVWDYKSIDISNAGDAGDQLDQEFKKGTMQRWMVRCPHCSNPHHEANAVYHQMQTRWREKRPEMGGLKYDAEGCRLSHYEYNYNKLRPTIRYQFPCGGTTHNEDSSARRLLSSTGKYSDPLNIGAELARRSYTYDSVIVDYIDWMSLIQDKHDALRSRSGGDPEPWKRYMREKECIPYDPNEVPIVGLITTTVGLKKNRKGLEGNKLRFAMLDRQQGRIMKGELPHWWLVIRDYQIVDGKLKSLLVYEGKIEDDGQVVVVINEHTVNPWHVCADSGDDTAHVYAFCLKNGYNAIKGGTEQMYTHPGGTRRIFSLERPLHGMVGQPSMYPYVDVDVGGGIIEQMADPREPLFWLYSKFGIRERLRFIMAETDFQIPDDVSEDYNNHMEAEEFVEERRPSDNSVFYKFVQHKDRNDLYVCECYGAMFVDQAGMILGDPKVSQEKKGQQNEQQPVTTT